MLDGDGDADGPGRGAHLGKGLERFQGGPVRGGKAQRDAGSVCHNGMYWLLRRGQNDSIALAQYCGPCWRTGNICYRSLARP